MRIIQVCLS